MAISTSRLELIPADRAMLEAELDSPARLIELLDAKPPASWPPPLYDQDALRYVLDLLDREGAHEVWALYYLLLGESRELVGIAGFKGAPNAAGEVEIGYSVVPERQRQGVATEAVGALVRRAMEHSQVHSVIAETLPDLTPSIRVLERNGFRLLGEGSEPGVIRYARERR